MKNFSKKNQSTIDKIPLIGMSNERLSGKTSPAQPDSGNSKLATRPLCPYCPLVFKIPPAQADSGDNMRGDLPPVVYNIWSAQSTKY